jgi:hypothetical protein
MLNAFSVFSWEFAAWAPIEVIFHHCFLMGLSAFFLLADSNDSVSVF